MRKVTKKNRNVLIVGAGYTGLVAALRLAESGNKVTLIEKSNIIGGLASSFKIENSSLERAYHHIFKTDTNIIELANYLGIGDKIKWHDSSVSMYYDNKLYPFKGAFDLVRFKPISFLNRLRAGLVVLYLQKTKRWENLKSISAYEWMLKFAGKQVTKVIWEPLLKGKFDKYYNKVSMAWLWARVHIRAQSREVGGEKLGYFEGGFQVFTDAILKRLKDLKVEIKTNTSISMMSNTKDNRVEILIGKRKATYDSAIVTIPSHSFAELIKHNKNIGHPYINKLKSIDYLGARILIFSSTQNISPYYWHNINDLDLPFLVFINHTNLIDKVNYNGKYIYYIATYIPHDHKLFSCTDKSIEQIWFKSLKKIFPDFNASLVREKHHIKLSNAQHIVSTDYSDRLPSAKTPINNVFLSNFSQIYPEDRGTNYAVREGEKIAKFIK